MTDPLPTRHEFHFNRDLSLDNGDAEVIELCRCYVTMDQEGREAWHATINADLAFKLVSFAFRTGHSLVGQTPSDIEVALLAAGLAYEHWLDDRDIMAATDDMRKLVEGYGEAPHFFIERVTPLLPMRAAVLLRDRFRRNSHKIRFVDKSNSDLAKHNVFDTLLRHPRFVHLLVSAIEAALQIRIDRCRLRELLKAVWMDQLPNKSFMLTTDAQAIQLVVQVDKHRGEIVVRFECQPPTGLWTRWTQRGFCQRASERFRAVAEGFAIAFAPTVFANVDRITVFKRSTQHIFEWQRNKPILKQS